MVFGLAKTLQSPLTGTPQIIAAVENALPHDYPIPTLDHDRHDMAKEKEHKPRIEILLDSPCLFLKGVGVEVEPTRLSGHVALYLSQATPMKEITLQFQGKARLPIPPAAALTIMNTAPLTYIVCTHDWSFLGGENRAIHTLKAGRHLFPFQLEIGGSIPSTTSSPALGGVAMSYRLHAQAVRSGFAFSQTYQADLPVYILRSFPREAREYQQSLEIEKTWPEKLMCSIMVPHEAWAAGDKLTALVKFTPLLQGACVLNVTTSIYEQTRLYARSSKEETRLVASVEHGFVNGQAVEVVNSRPGHRKSWSFRSSPASPASPSSGFGAGNSHRTNNSTSLGRGRHSLSQSPIHATPSTHQRPPVASTSNFSHETIKSDSNNNEVNAHLSIDIPLTIIPTHSLEPILALHRICWNIILRNWDGHTSELECSLPLHLLDHRLLGEAQSHTAATRRLLIGGADIPSGEAEDTQLPEHALVCSPPRSPHTGDSVTGSGTIRRTHSRSRSHSHPGSRALSPSRLSSRATSVEREQRERDRHPPIAPITVAGPHETYVHNGHASQNTRSLLSTLLKPSGTMFPSGWTFDGSAHQPPFAAGIEREAFMEMLNHAVASGALVGGMPPLSGTEELPSYEEAVRRR
ncbi:hypothetical protein D9615_002596 [Tricholomella constricta]|uniref:Arrestin C-terminal-like domain-containing protein n=1 Tax=Tricholomella constricta TaxID=117010 RepID=A0A8H5HMT2_9AGAR|nr:hypothetical protein D9615_002596 [Tricholomella constricta]